MEGEILTIKITTLIENSLGENQSLQNEHGLSFFIDIEGNNCQKILFDTGQSNTFITNAQKLGVDLTTTDRVVLSHSHYDHTGGFVDFIKSYGSDFQLYVGPGFFTPKYANNNRIWKFLGNNFEQEDLEDRGIKIEHLYKETTELVKGVYVMTNFTQTNTFEKASSRFYIRNGNDYKRDFFTDEVVLVLEAKAGLIVLLGCSHPGVVNILEAVQNRLNKPLHCVMGGTHLVGASKERLDESIKYLQKLELPFLGLSHCTGDDAINRVQKEIEHFFLNTTGTTLVFE